MPVDLSQLSDLAADMIDRAEADQKTADRFVRWASRHERITVERDAAGLVNDWRAPGQWAGSPAGERQVLRAPTLIEALDLVRAQ